MSPVTVQRSVELDATPEEVWPQLVDTDRLNRRMGMNTVSYAPISEGRSASGARITGTTRLGGFLQTYEELPFEWREGEGLFVRREFLDGPLSWLSMRFQLEPSPTGSRFTVTLESAPRLSVLRPLAWLNQGRAAQQIIELAQEMAAFARARGPNPYSAPVSPHDRRALDTALDALGQRGVDPAMAARLGELVRSAPDADCARMRPLELAVAWGVDARATLLAFLHAVPAGLLELRWSLVCPSCNTQATAVPRLVELPQTGHCALCDIDFELSLDQAVEATFTPHAAVRPLPDQPFCIAGPGRTPHVIEQINVGSGEERALRAPDAPGRYRVFVRGGARTGLRVEEGAAAEILLEIDDVARDGEERALRPGGAIRLKNRGLERRHVKLEHLVYASRAATAHLLSGMPEFRSLFSGELLKPGTALKVSRVALLFTDLVGSTALYDKVGDAAAFRFVDDHFDALGQAIALAGGVVVKTMGDAVMAAFPDEEAAVLGAEAALRAFERFRAGHPLGEQVGLKLGLHAGPSYVVTANGALDYFGQTVNLAARLQHLAERGEIVLEQRTLAACSPATAAGLEGARFSARVKGVDQPLELLRLRPRERADEEPTAEQLALPSAEQIH